MQAALASAPVAIGNVATWNNGGGNIVGQTAGWNGGGGKVTSYDVNAGVRNDLIDTCLRAKGWVWTKVLEVPHGHLENTPNGNSSGNNPH